MKKRNPFLRELWPVLVLLAGIAVSEYYFFELWRMDWNVPMLYGGDGIYWVGQVARGFSGMTGRLGWPLYTTPPAGLNYDSVYDAFIAFVGLFTKNVGVGFNIYVLIIPFADALAAYAVFRILGVRRSLSVAVAMTFGMCPYVQQRLGGHMMLAASEFVPFSILLCILCAEQPDFNRPRKGFLHDKRSWLALAVCYGISANGGIYYPYFTCFSLCVTALCLVLRDKDLRRAISCLFTVVEICLLTATCALPVLWSTLTGAGGNATNGVYRSPTGPDIYGLRISSLLLSPNGYGWDKLAARIKQYFHFLAVDEDPMFNENSMGYLGIVGILGFMLLLVLLFQSRRWGSGKTERPALGDRLWLLSRITVGALLLCTIAGFGPIIGIVFTYLRGYNRMSVYIAFMALLAFALCAEELLTRLRQNKRRFAAVAVGLAVLLCYGYWEQQGLFTPKYESVRTTWYQDDAFMTAVEADAGEDAVLFQLPYMKSFENGSLVNMWDYTLLRGPLHSRTLKFSYGAADGSENDIWYRETAALAPAACVAELNAKGIAGIYLDLDGYDPDVREETLAAYTAAAGCDANAVLRSEGQTLCYIPLKG